MPFGGETYDRSIDKPRLSTQFVAVRELLLAAAQVEMWFTLHEIELDLGYPQASISARIRDLRKEKFGGYEVERRRRTAKSGTWEYRIVLPVGQLTLL